MSLIGFAVRTCLWKALLGQTLAGNAVENAPVDPVAVAVEIAQPYIAVFTDTENNKPDARSMVEGYHVQDVSLQLFLPPDIKMTIGGVPYDFEGRSSGAALVMDLIHRQLELVLMSGQSVWAKLWRVFVVKFIEIDSRAYVLQDAKTSVRTPAREITMRCDTIFSPPIGAVPDGPWADLVAALTADPDTAELGPLLAGMISGELLPQWRQDEADLGLVNGDMAAMGLGPVTAIGDRGRFEEDQAADEVKLDQVTFYEQGQTEPPTVVAVSHE